MKVKFIKFLLIFLIVIGLLLIIYPFVEINYKNKIIRFAYSDDISVYEDYSCYDESYFYNEKKDISISNYDFYKFMFFHIIKIEYIDGNVCEREYILEEEYIIDFIENAEIIENTKNINVEKLIKNKKAIVGNKRYLGNDYENSIFYTLNNKEEILYVFYVDDLVVIQVGLTDEGPKYIAYK